MTGTATELTTLDFLAANVSRLAARMVLSGDDGAFVRGQARRALGDAVDDPDQLPAAVDDLSGRHFEQLSDPDLAGHPLVVLARAFGLSPFELDLVLFSALTSLDERFASSVARLGGLDSLGHPSVASAMRILVSDDDDRAPIRSCLKRSPLWSHRVLLDGDTSRTGFERRAQPSGTTLAFLDSQLPATIGGDPTILWTSEADAELATTLEFRTESKRVARELIASSPTDKALLLHVPAEDPTETWLLCRAIASASGRGIIRVVLRQGSFDETFAELTLVSTLCDVIPVLECGAGVEAVEIPIETSLRSLFVVATSARCQVRAPDSLRMRTITPPRAGTTEQAQAWRHFLGPRGDSADVDLLSSRTHLSIPSIAEATRLACELAAVDGRDAPGQQDIERALSEVAPQPTSALARTLRPSIAWKDLVLDRDAKQCLGDLVRRIKHRVTVQGTWGLAKNGDRGHGLVAILHGDSGTGKTLAAEVVASTIGLPMLAVDLSRVVSKYIGESEKQLSELFELAEGYRSLLFFDEADALFGKRTGVRDSHDRFANIGINYLLQRLETFEGIAILSTNLMQNLDEAFLRRIHFSIHFPRPTRSQQHAIWCQHLPLQRLDESVVLEELVSRFDLVGGEIRNAALTASYGAAAREGIITAKLLTDAIRLELVKKGRPVPHH